MYTCAYVCVCVHVYGRVYNVKDHPKFRSGEEQAYAPCLMSPGRI